MFEKCKQYNYTQGVYGFSNIISSSKLVSMYAKKISLVSYNNIFWNEGASC